MRFVSRETLVDAQFELVAHQVEVGTTLTGEFVMRALLNDAAVVQHDDLIGIAHGAQPMCDHQDRSAMAEFSEVLHDHPLVAGIERAGRFVEEQEIRILVDRSRNEHALGLPTAERDARRTEPRVVA